MSGQQSAIFAGGCFWGMEELFRSIKGVIETTVGYIGGNVSNPKYEQVKTGRSGHAEAILIQFDPNVVSYESLVEFFFRVHDPTTLNRQGGDIGTQYRSAIFYFNQEQLETAQRVLKQVQQLGKWKGQIVTTFEEAKNFFPAEEYHQDYLQKNPNGYTCHYIRW